MAEPAPRRRTEGGLATGDPDLVPRPVRRLRKREVERLRRDVGAAAELPHGVGDARRAGGGRFVEGHHRVEAELAGAVVSGRERDEQVAPVPDPVLLVLDQQRVKLRPEQLRRTLSQRPRRGLVDQGRAYTCAWPRTTIELSAPKLSDARPTSLNISVHGESSLPMSPSPSTQFP